MKADPKSDTRVLVFRHGASFEVSVRTGDHHVSMLVPLRDLPLLIDALGAFQRCATSRSDVRDECGCAVERWS